MLLLGQMFKLTPKSVRKRAEEVAIQVVSSGLGQSKMGHHSEIVIKARSLRPDFRVHKIVIRQYASDPQTLMQGGLNRRLASWVHCSCDYFKFVCEVALARHKSSSIIRSNGAAPMMTNPKFIPMVCKHIAAVVLIKPNLNFAGVTNKQIKNVPVQDVVKTHKEVDVMTTKQGPFLHLARESDKLDQDLADLL